MLEITIDNSHKYDLEKLLIQIVVNIFGLIEEIQKLKANVAGKLFSISIKTYQDKNVGKN